MIGHHGLPFSAFIQKVLKDEGSRHPDLLQKDTFTSTPWTPLGVLVNLFNASVSRSTSALRRA
jgi:hypothetical protein